MTEISRKFFDVSSHLREQLRTGIKGPISIVEMRGLEFFLQNKAARQKDLAAYWGITNASTSAFIAKMEQRGFIERTRDPNDRRASVLKVTNKGNDAITKMQKSAAEVSKPVFERLTPEETMQLSRILDKLSTN